MNHQRRSKNVKKPIRWAWNGGKKNLPSMPTFRKKQLSVIKAPGNKPEGNKKM